MRSFYEPQNACCKYSAKNKQEKRLSVLDVSREANAGVVEDGYFVLCVAGCSYWSCDAHLWGAPSQLLWENAA